MKTYFELTKSGIVLFVVVSGMIGFLIATPVHQTIEMWQAAFMAIGLYFLSSGSFIINQAQERTADALMPRTRERPIPTGKVQTWQAYTLGVLFVLVGLAFLLFISSMSAYVGILSLVLYNGFYTLWWKPKMSFGAVPGAIPGALPIVIGYAGNNPNVFTPDCIYLFLIMFLWQMPHFWCLAIHYQKDYLKGNFPVLPAIVGLDRTLYHIGLYVFAYVGVALIAPWFIKTTILHLLLVVPFALKVMYEFYKYFRSKGRGEWLPFFLWTNLSMLVFIGVPVFDKWIYYNFI